MNFESSPNPDRQIPDEEAEPGLDLDQRRPHIPDPEADDMISEGGAVWPDSKEIDPQEIEGLSEAA